MPPQPPRSTQDTHTQLQPKAKSKITHQTPTFSISQLLKHRQPKNTNIKDIIITQQINSNTIQKYNNEINQTKHTNKTKKTHKIPTFNTKFSLRGSSLADASENHPGGQWNRHPGMGGELVVIRDLHQGPSATSSLADSQQQSSAVSQPNKHKKHQNYFSNKKHILKEPTQNTQNTQTNNTPHSQNTNSPSPTPQINTRASAKPWRHKKGRTTNRLNSKQLSI